jgi:hypothetical protein
MALIVDPDDLNQGTEVTITTGTRLVTLNIAGNLSNDGVTLQALYSFFKEEWKTDAALIPHPFPQVAITPEQFEWIEDWKPFNDATRKLIRTGGWKEIDENDVLQKEWAGIISLGTFEDTADQAYFQQGDDPTDTSAAQDFNLAGPVNEAIEIYDNVTPADDYAFATGPDTITRTTGSWVTDGYRIGGRVEVSNAEDSGNNGTFTITAMSATVLTVTGVTFTVNANDTTATFAVDHRDKLKLFLRIRDADPNGKTYDDGDLSDIGVTLLQNQVYRFPLSNDTDLKISETDANIDANTPYTQINISYFDADFNMDIDTVDAERAFGIVIDVGTFSGVDAVTNGTVTVTTADAGIPTTTYDGGTLTLHDASAGAGADKGNHSVSTASGGTITLDTALTQTESALSFTLQRSTPVVATAEEIYEKVQRELRRAADIDNTAAVVTGKTADELLEFIGDTLEAGDGPPTNPNGGGSGVVILGFDANDTNRLIFVDNTGTSRTFPFVAAGTITFNNNLVTDTAGEFWMFFEYTERFTNTGFGLSGASGPASTLDSSVTDLVAELSNGDYINLTGFATENNNGIHQLTGAPAGTGPWTAAITKTDTETVSNESAGPTVSMDKNPINSPDAIIVKDNSASDIVGAVSASVGFDFDYDNNVQGGRTSGTDADIVIRAIGLETAQFVETFGKIIQAVGQSFSVVAALERNYSNP